MTRAPRNTTFVARVFVGAFVQAPVVALAMALVAPLAFGRSVDEIRAERPDLFHPETGLRIGRYRAPTPDAAPGAVRVDAADARSLIESGAVALDVGAAAQSRYDELDGAWLVSKPHASLPGAVWLPEVGRGALDQTMRRYLASNLDALAAGDKTAPVLVFCIADCWMSWNAAQRVAGLGYRRVYWFPEGLDGWLDAGWELSPVDPVPVDVD